MQMREEWILLPMVGNKGFENFIHTPFLCMTPYPSAPKTFVLYDSNRN